MNDLFGDFTPDYAALSAAYEPNDTPETATELGDGSYEVTGSHVDWYRFEVASGDIALDLTPLSEHNGSIQNVNMALYADPDGPALTADFQPGANTESIRFLAGEAGTYYARVFLAQYANGNHPDGMTFDYRLNVDLPEAQASDGNDTLATATPIGESSQTRSGTGVDWYRVDAGPGEMNFSMTGRAFDNGTVPNLNLTLYDEDGTVLRANRAGAGATEAFSYIANGEDSYYLQVNWAAYPDGAPNGYTMRYDLDVDLPSGTWSVPVDFGPVRGASVTVYDIDGDGKDEIFAGTGKLLDAQGNEIRAGGLVVLEDDGTVKWTQTFDAAPGVDPATGKTYETSSVSTAAVFSDIDGDGSIDILVGTGADNGSTELELVGQTDEVVGQPGDMGGVHALNADGTEKWFFQTRDTFGNDGRSDGVRSTPRVFDIDGDGVREVIFTSWDHYLYILDGRNGALEYEFNLHDTAGATPAVADIDGDGVYDIVVPSDITSNAAAGVTAQGGILQVLSNYTLPNIEGWMDQIGNTTSADFRGEFDEQSLWSSPQIVDLDRDGTPEIVQGTGNFFQDGRGEYIKVWNADGTLRFQRDTDGRVMADTLVADLDGNGTMEIVAATTSGHVYGWSASGQQIFATEAIPYGAVDNADGRPIASQPIAVDLNNDGDLEILVSVGSQMIALDRHGTQISGVDQAERVYHTYAGSPVAKDIDGDGRLDLISGGSTIDGSQGVIYRFENQFDVVSDDYRTGAYQGAQSLHDIRAFVGRFYDTILGREADADGSNSWTDRLYTGVRTGADVARGFIFSAEFTSRGTSNTEYVETLYSAFFGRPADAGGLSGWVGRLEDGMDRAQVLDGFIYSQEFANLADSYGILVDNSQAAGSDAAVITGNGADANTLIGSAGDNVIYDEGSSVQEVHANDKQVSGQVYRLYGATLGRAPDPGGFEGWVGGLQSNLGLVQVAGGFVQSTEFQNTYGDLDNESFVELLYQNVLGREADAGGLANWVGNLEGGMSRAQVVVGFSESAEYQVNTRADLDYFMRTADLTWNDVIEGGAGNDVMNGNTGADIFVFRAGQGGNDIIHGFEPWDMLQLSGFGFETAAQAKSHMVQSGAHVVFNHGGQSITFLNTSRAEMDRVRYNLS